MPAKLKSIHPGTIVAVMLVVFVLLFVAVFWRSAWWTGVSPGVGAPADATPSP